MNSKMDNVRERRRSRRKSSRKSRRRKSRRRRSRRKSRRKKNIKKLCQNCLINYSICDYEQTMNHNKKCYYCRKIGCVYKDSCKLQTNFLFNGDNTVCFTCIGKQDAKIDTSLIYNICIVCKNATTNKERCIVYNDLHTHRKEIFCLYLDKYLYSLSSDCVNIVNNYLF